MTTLNQLIDQHTIVKGDVSVKDGAFISIHLLADALRSRSGPVRVAGLGTFRVVKLKSRVYRHPKSGKRCEVGPRTVVRFKPSSKLSF